MEKDFRIPLKKTANVVSKEDLSIGQAISIETVDFRLRHDTDSQSGAYWYARTPKGTTFSVVDMVALFKSCPDEFLQNHFNFWEAIEIKPNGKLDNEMIYRAKTPNALAQMIGNS